MRAELISVKGLAYKRLRAEIDSDSVYLNYCSAIIATAFGSLRITQNLLKVTVCMA